MSISLERLKSFWNHSPRANLTFLVSMVLLQVVIHLPMISLSPRGMHVWRQVVGHAAVQNYIREDDRFWYPRADIRMTEGDTGEVYHELPLTYWLAAEATKAGWADQNTAAHAMQLLFNLLMIPGAFYTFLALSKNRNRSALFTFLIGFSPLYLYYAPLCEPNLLGLSFFLAGLGLILPRIESGRYGLPFFAGMFLLTLGTLAKPTFLFFGLPIAAFAIPHLIRGKSWRAFLSLLTGVAFLALANGLVLKHAQHLYDLSPWQRQFHTPIGPSPAPDSWSLVWTNVSRAATTWFLEMNINLAAIPLLLIALVLVFKKTATPAERESPSFPSRLFWWGWLGSVVVFCSIFVVRLADHDYYIASSLPLAALMSSRGAEIWLRSKRYLPILALIMLVAVPYIGVTRAYGRWYGHALVPETLLTHAANVAAGIPEKDLILVDGDKTPIVFLYYLQRKGLSLLLVEGKLTSAELRPFKWLVRWNGSKIFSPIAERLDLSPVSSTDDFTVYRILDVHDEKSGS